MRAPLIIDEIQKAPELLDEIKLICDNSEQCGQYWLTGSQQFSAMKCVRESLAGRVGILNLYGLSFSEFAGNIPFLNNDLSLNSFLLRSKEIQVSDVNTIFDFIWRGGYSQVKAMDDEMRYEFYNSYVQTFLLRDAVDYGGISDESKFLKFLSACASLTSQTVNYAKLAEIADITQPTAKTWLGILQSLGVVYLLQPFQNNMLKRLSKSPKLYFCDTGLGSFLARWLTKDSLMMGAASGQMFENFVVMEFLKHFAYAGKNANLCNYRRGNTSEIDLIVELDGKVFPFEIKQSASPKFSCLKTFSELNEVGLNVKFGGIVCMSDKVLPIDEKYAIIPASIL